MVGILAMMFLVLFASLATTMAVVTQGNLRSSVSHQRVTRSIGAVDTGLELATSRLAEASNRFVVARSEITPEFADALWHGTYSGGEVVQITPPPMGRIEDAPATSLQEALRYHHDADDPTNLVSWPEGDNVPAPIPQPAAPDGWVVASPIGLERSGDGLIVTAAQITYVPPDALGRVLVVVTGYNWDFTRNRWVSRTAQQYFDMTKKVEHAILAPSRLMIGRNVQINGPLGVSYNSQALNEIDGPPLYMKSDFYGLDAELDEKLDDFFAAVLANDVDGDNRLRGTHAIEALSLASLNQNDYDGDSIADTAFGDITYDGITDEFDIFIRHYDQDNDGRLVLSSALTIGTPVQGSAAEFEADDALAMLIDAGAPDRDQDGLANGAFVDGAWDFATFRDNNGDGIIDGGDVDVGDVVLGYRDGVLDYKDRYAKVRGSIQFRADRADWEAMTDEWGAPIDDYQNHVQGTILPAGDDNPIIFQADDVELPEISPESFAAATQTLLSIVEDDPLCSFADQVAAQKGSTWTPATVVESTPYGSPTPSDWYERPYYANLTFRNVKIPLGTNALFENCTFIGVTFVDSYEDNTHPSWPFYGSQTRDPETGALEWQYPQDADSDIALDKSWADPDWDGYDALPDPLFVDVDLDGDGVPGDQCINTKLVTNNIRFHDCLFVGSIVSRRTTVFHNKRNKIQFTGATQFTDRHPDYPDDAEYNPPPDEMEEIAKSSMMLPNYSVDIGTNNSDPDQDVLLRGAIIAGVVDIRGNATIEGVLLADFTPVYGQPPLWLYGEAIGDPADFNMTLGYFGPEDGDAEGINLSDLEDLDGDGTLDIGRDSARDPETGALIPASAVEGIDPADYPDNWFDGVVDTDAEWVPGDWVSRPVAFNGYGKITINWDPDLLLPDGLAAPLHMDAKRSTYEEGRYVIGADDAQ